MEGKQTLKQAKGQQLGGKEQTLKVSDRLSKEGEVLLVERSWSCCPGTNEADNGAITQRRLQALTTGRGDCTGEIVALALMRRDGPRKCRWGTGATFMPL